MKNKPKIFNELEKFAPLIPAPISWLDVNGVALGGNDLIFQAIGANMSREKVIGKTPYEFYPKDVADPMMDKIKQVVQEKKLIASEESIIDIETGKRRWFLATRAPLFNYSRTNVVGIIATSIEITDRKEAERLRIETELQKVKLKEQEDFKKIVNQAAYDTQSPLAILLILIQRCTGLARKEVFATLKELADITPTNLYWFDENNAVMGANQHNIKSIGGKSITDFIGKTPYDYFPFEMAENAVKHNNLVMQTGRIISKEELTKNLATGETKYFTVFKGPLYDNNGKSIGVLCTAADITVEKNAELLKLEAERQRVKLEEQEQFKKVVDQVVHDIRSPLASLLMIIKSYEKDIPEQIRIPLRDASINIADIANNLLSRYEKDDTKILEIEEEPQPVMIALVLSQILSDKKYQYKEMDIKFSDDFCHECKFIFIKVQSSAFKRMISNLVNNAVEALEGKKGIIHLGLSIEKNNIKIIVQDNGKGLPQEIVDKILNNAVVGTDKKKGHGIGLTQIREALEHNQGKLAITSKLGEGTKMTLTFPTIEAPNWVAKEIKVNKGDTIVILDDDQSIHGAWDSRFKDRLNEVQLKHFLVGNQAIEFVNAFSEKEKVFLLTDFELLKQDLNGIDIIEKANVKRAVLVTSHYAEIEVRKLAIKSGIKILPKQLASDISIEVCEVSKTCVKVDKPTKIDIVIIDDNAALVNSVEAFLKNYNKTVDKYYNPMRFLDNISHYDKDTRIFMDNDFGSNNISGIELAKQLHESGFTKLYLFSGKDFVEEEVPGYLKIILKTDIDSLCKAANL